MIHVTIQSSRGPVELRMASVHCPICNESREHQELLAQYDAVAELHDILLHDILSAQLIAEGKPCDWSPVRKLASECDRIAELIEAKGWSL